MPGNVALIHGFFDDFALLGRRLFKKLVEKPGPGSPDVTFLSSRKAELARGLYRFRKIFFEKPLHHASLRVRESRIKMTFERHEHPLYVWVSCRRIQNILQRQQSRSFRQQCTAEKRFHEFAPVHVQSPSEIGGDAAV